MLVPVPAGAGAGDEGRHLVGDQARTTLGRHERMAMPVRRPVIAVTAAAALVATALAVPSGQAKAANAGPSLTIDVHCRAARDQPVHLRRELRRRLYGIGHRGHGRPLRRQQRNAVQLPQQHDQHRLGLVLRERRGRPRRRRSSVPIARRVSARCGSCRWPATSQEQSDVAPVPLRLPDRDVPDAGLHRLVGPALRQRRDGRHQPQPAPTR